MYTRESVEKGKSIERGRPVGSLTFKKIYTNNRNERLNLISQIEHVGVSSLRKSRPEIRQEIHLSETLVLLEGSI